MNAFIRRPSRRREPGYVSASDLVTNSLQRNWKVNDPKTKSGSSPDLRHASEALRQSRTESPAASDFDDEMETRQGHARVAPRRSASLSQADRWGQVVQYRSSSPQGHGPENGRWRSLSPPTSAALWTGASGDTEAQRVIDGEWEVAEKEYCRSHSSDSTSPAPVLLSDPETEVPTLRRKKKRMDEMLMSEVKKFRERRKDVRTTTKETRRSSHGNVYYHTLETSKTVRESDYSKRSQSLDRPNTKQKHVNRIYLKQDSKSDFPAPNFESVPDYAWTKRDTFKHIIKERFAIPRGLIVEVKQNQEVPSYATLVKPPRRQKSTERSREVEGMVTLPRTNKNPGNRDHITRINIMQDAPEHDSVKIADPPANSEAVEDVSSGAKDVKNQGSAVTINENPPRQRVSSSSSSSVKNTVKIRPGSTDSSASKRNQCSQSDTASDIVIDNERIHPDGDDYKLVFISSGSSKSSLEDSFDQENPEFSRRPSSLLNESDNAGFIDESDWDFYLNERKASKAGTSGKKILSDSWTELRQVLNDDQLGGRLPLFDEISEIGSQYEGDVSSSNSPCPKLVSRAVQTEESGSYTEKTKHEVMIEIIRALSEERQIDNQDLRFSKSSPYSRSDSKRSSAERSIEEFSFSDHIATTLRTASAKEIPELIQTTPELQQYASSILNDIFAYTLSCKEDGFQHKQINGSEKSLTSGVHSQSELSDSDSDSFPSDVKKPKKRKFKPSEKLVSRSIVEIRSDIAGPSEVSFLTDMNESIHSDSGVTIRCSSEKSDDTSMLSVVGKDIGDDERHLVEQETLVDRWQQNEVENPVVLPVPAGASSSLAQISEETGSGNACFSTIAAKCDEKTREKVNKSFILIKNSPVLNQRESLQMTEPTVISDNDKVNDSGVSVKKKPLKSILRSSSFNEPVKTPRKIRRTASNPNAKLKHEKWDTIPVLRESDSKSSVDVLSDSENDFLDRDLMAEERKFQKSKEMKVLPEDMSDEPPVLHLRNNDENIQSGADSSDSDSEFTYTLEITEVADPAQNTGAESAVHESVPESSPESIETASEWTASECVTLLSAKPIPTELSDNNSPDNTVIVREMMTTGSHLKSVHSSFIRETLRETDTCTSFTRFEVLRVSSPEGREASEDTGFETDSYQNTIVDAQKLNKEFRELLSDESGVNLISYADSSIDTQDPNSNELEDPPETHSALTKYFTDLDNHPPITNRKQPVTHILEKSILEDSISSDTTLVDTSDQTLDHDDSFCEDITDIKDISMEEREYDLESYGESERMDSVDDQESNYSESLSSGDEAFADREEDLRGYNRPIDFTLHTIMEESCEESDSEKIKREKVKVQPDPTNLEKYFKFELCGNNPNDVKFANEESEFSDTVSETSSSIYSEGIEQGDEMDPVDLASSRLEKYFLTGFLGLDPYGIQKTVQKSEGSSDDSQSVGSDSEGHPSPEQKRKKVIKLRGFRNQQRQERPESMCSDISTTSNQPDDKEVRAETPTTSEEETAFEKTDGQFDTIKRHKKRRSAGEDIENAKKALNFSFDSETVSDGEKVVPPEPPAEVVLDQPENQEEMKKTKSRDSGFVGSCDDLLSESKPADTTSDDFELVLAKQPVLPIEKPPTPPSTSTNLSRKDSFNNWSSDEETNLMMNKMRAFFRNMISKNGEGPASTSPPAKSPQMLAFEAELTRLMKTVPGINDEQVKEIVEYLSSEDTWSDSYDSSDYTSSDLEGAYAAFDPSVLNFAPKSELQEQISASCQEIIGQFDGPPDLSPILSSENLVPPIPAGEDLNNSLNRETAFVYQRLVTSLIRLNRQPDTLSSKSNSTPSQTTNTSSNSPPIIAAALQHIGNRLVALMHEVSAGSDSNSNSGSIGEERSSKKQIPRPQPGKFPAPTPPLSHPTTSSSDSPTDNELSTESDDNQGGKRLSLSEKLVSSLPIIPPRKLREDTRDFSSLESPGRVPVPMPRARLQDRLRKSAEPSPTDFDRRQLGSAQSSRSASHEDILDNEDSIKSKLSARFYKLNRESREALQSSSSGVSDIAERDDDAYWRSSFESAIAADSRTKLSLEAKRRSAGSESSSEHFGSSELHLEREARRLRSSAKPSSKFSLPNLLERDSNRVAREREGEREKSASSDVLLTTSPIGSRSILNTIDQGEEPEEEWDRLRQSRLSARRRSSVPDTREDQRPSVKDEERSTTLPRTTGPVSLSTITQATTSKSQTSLLRDETPSPVETTVRSARYRPPGFKHQLTSLRPPMRAPSAPGLSSEAGTTRPWGESSLFFQRRNVKSVIEDDVFDVQTSLVTSSPSVRREGFPKGGTWGGSNASSAPGLSGAPSDTTSDGSEKSFLGTPKLRGSIFGLSSRSDSLASVCSAVGDVRYGTVPVKGEVQFGLHYNYRQAAFEVAVKMCKDLAPVDTKRNRSDPYVKVYLLPDRSKSGKRKTKVKRHTLSPIFDEVLKFYISLEELEVRTLWLSVWHSDMFGRNDFLGEVTIPLAGRVFDDPLPKWFPLQERSDALDDSASVMTSRGDVIIALKYVTTENLQGSRRGKKSRGALQVLVREARNLMPLRLTGTADPLCKACLLPERGKNAKQKTNVSRRTLNPCWNHTFVFDDVTPAELQDRSLEITIWDHERVASNEFMGGVRLGLGTGMHNGRPAGWADSVGPEVGLWQDMLDRPGLWCEGTVPLRPTLGKSIVSESQ